MHCAGPEHQILPGIAAINGRRVPSQLSVRNSQSMMPKKPAPDLMRGGYRFSENIMPQQ